MIGRSLTLLGFSLFIFSCQNERPQTTTSSNREAEIRQVLDKQVAAWNEGNLEAFMETYWKSDSLQFIGSQITSGWQSTLEGYKLRYPDVAAMGETRFEIMQIRALSDDVSLATGKYFLTRESGDLKGIFSVILRKIDGKWVVVYDHTSEIKS